MPMIKSNDPNNDDIVMRETRLDSLQYNINLHAAELGLSAELIAWGQTCFNVFQKLVVESSVDSGEATDASIWAKIVFKETKKLYQQVKEIVIARCREFKPDPYLLDKYGVDHATPRTYDGVLDVANQLVQTHNELVAAGDPRIVPQVIIDRLIAGIDKFVDAIAKNNQAHDTAMRTRNDRRATFAADTEKLRYIYRTAALIFGENDLRLKDLGFLPRHSVWTKKVPPTPQHVEFDPASRILSWQGLEGIDSYEAEWRSSDSHKGDHWTSFYDGEADRCTVPAELYAVDLRVRAVAGGKESHWSKVIQIAD